MTANAKRRRFAGVCTFILPIMRPTRDGEKRLLTEPPAENPRLSNGTVRLATGAELRVTGPAGSPAVVCVNGGQRAEVPGTWSATLEWLVARLAPRFPGLAFAEGRYRVKSWTRLDLCEEDARAAIAAVAAPRTLLVGFSMGGAVAVRSADAPGVEAVLGL